MSRQSLLFTDDLEPPKPVNVASVPHRSPFRYPGGKTWFIPRLRDWIDSFDRRQRLLVEPFAGGGIVALTAIFENLVDEVIMVELDREIASVWRAIIEGEGDWLSERILSFEMTRENVIAELECTAADDRGRAFQTILKNRTFHGGILAKGSGLLKKGENGKGVASRWYPVTLAKRINEISTVRHRITFIQGDAFDILEEYSQAEDTLFFIDPPYTAGGKKAGSRLYNHCELDHGMLFEVSSQLTGDFLMTYDNAIEVKALAQRYHFEAKPIPMKNTHHAPMTELVIGRDLNWMNGIDRVVEEQANYS